MDQIRKPYASLAAALFVSSFALVPLSAAESVGSLVGGNVGVCGIFYCVQTSTETPVYTVTQTQACGGSGNVIVQAGDNNTANVCNQNASHGSGNFVVG